MREFSRFLYRYSSKDDYILDVIANKRLYFCHPSEFNDPFDCKPLISIQSRNNVNDKTWYQLLFYLAKLQYPELPDSEIRKNADAAFAKGLYKDQLWLNQVDEMLMNLEPLVRVCCFAKTPRNTMMWAHYAQNHSGVVFQFRTPGLYDHAPEKFCGFTVTYSPGALNVQKYVEALERGFEHNDYLAMARLFYTTKTIHWDREEEVRFFSDSGHAYIPFDETALSGIVFGDKCSPWLIRRVLDELLKWLQRPKLFQVSIKNSSSKLCICKYREIRDGMGT